MTGPEAVAALEARSDAERAARMADHHKVPRRYLGVPVSEIEALVEEWRDGATVETRVTLAAALWDTNVHEARVAAAKLLTQARIRPDDGPVWKLLASWVPGFDARAIADLASRAGERRLVAAPRRLDEVETWVNSDHVWTRRASLVMTLPWTKDRFAKPEDLERRDRILGWCGRLAVDRDPLIQKAVALWLSDLSRKDPERVRLWLVDHGGRLAPFARREAERHVVSSRDL